MKKYLAILIFISCSAIAQQTVQYTQYMLNDLGFNPAAAGDSKDYEILLGKRLQWVGFDNAPITNFGSVNRAFFKKPYRNYWHGLGIYIEEDKAGLITTKAIYPMYAFHFMTPRKGMLTIGITAGLRFYGVGSSLFDQDDPALANYPLKLTYYPDINAGVRYLTHRKLLIDVSVKQIYKNKVEQGSKKLSGADPIILAPHGYLTLAKRIYSKEYDYVFEPSMQLRTNFISLPSVSAGCMMFVGKHIGFGLSYRWADAVSGMLQLRFRKNIILGIAYDYTVSRLRATGANSLEIMTGMSPSRLFDGIDDDHNSGAQCPVWDF